MKIKLNLGCGDDYKEGYVNIDVNRKIKADIYTDFIEKGLPFEDSSVDEIYCQCLFEHIPNPLNFLLEMKRVLKKKGKAIIITSNASYIIYHFPRLKGYHDTYNLVHPLEDQHYMMFQRGHLIAFTKRAGMKIHRLEYCISDKSKGKNFLFQKFIGSILGKKFGYSDFLWVVEK